MTDREAIEATGSLHIVQAKPNYNVTFHVDQKLIGKLDFNGNVMTFEGDADESAKVFMDFIAMRFEQRLKEERAKENEECAVECDKWAAVKPVSDFMHGSASGARQCAQAIRERMK